MTFELYVPLEMMRMLSLMQRYSHFRWLDQLEAPLVVLEPGGMAIHLHLLHQWVLLRFLPPRRRFCGSWFKLSNNRGVGIMLITHKKRATKISSVLSLHCSIKRMSLWTRTFGFAHRVQVFSIDYSLFRSEQDSLRRAAASRISSYVVGSLPRDATG